MALGPLRNELVRNFLALPLAPLFQVEIKPLIQQGKQKFPSIRWVNPGEIHLTLHFFGSIDIKLIEEISRKVGPLVSTTKDFSLYLSKLGGFPSLKNPRIIWLGVEGEVEPLKDLYFKIEMELQKLGFPSEKREFKPHLTLGRVKVPQKKLNLEELTFKQTPSKPVKEIVLFKSHLGPNGAHYEAIKNFPFKNS